MSESSQFQRLTPAKLAHERQRGVLILDTRPTKEFVAFHIPGSMQIGLVGSFAGWAAILIEPSQKILLVAENGNCAQEAHSRLARVGLENVVGYSLADKKQWQYHGLELISLPMYQCEDLRHALRANPATQLLDVRSWSEWLQGHMPGATSMPLLELEEQAVSIDFSKPILVYCQEGYRATIAASILLRSHAADIGIVTGGFQEWQACGIPSERNEMSLPNHH